MNRRGYGAVAALVAVLTASGCADPSQEVSSKPPASVAPTALSQPSGGPVNLVATAPAPPPPTVAVGAFSSVTVLATGPAPTSAPEATVPTASGPPGTDTPGPDGQLYSKHAAELRVLADLAKLPLPKGAQRQAGAVPAAVNRTSGGIGATTASLDTWWTVPGRRADAQAFFAAQHPDGMSYNGGGGTDAGEVTLDFDYPMDAKAPGTFFEIGLAQDGDHTDVRLQLQVAYLPTRTAIETIPASVTTGTGVYQPPNQVLPANVTPAPKRTLALSAADVRIIATALNGVDAEPQIMHSCPAPNGEEAWFTLRYGGHTVVFHAELNGCCGVEVTSDGVPQPELGLGDDLYAAVHQSLHVTKAENPFLS